MKRLYTLLVLLLPTLCLAQHTITGRVLDITTQKPLAKASVFLSNATNGSSTAEDGNFTLKNVKPGQYDLVVSCIGYETYHYTITVNTSLTVPNLLLVPKNIELNVVTIKPDPNRERYLNQFKREFIGSSPFASECKLSNTDAINLRYDENKRTLVASTDGYILIENKALGYNIRYYLNKFADDWENNIIYYEGASVFEPMKGSAHQQKRWIKNREKAYYGSPEHFLRSCRSSTMTEEGFKVLRLIVKSNTERKPDSLIKAKLRQFRLSAQNDSLQYWAKQNSLPKFTQYLVNKPLDVNEFVKRTDQQGLLAFGLSDELYVMYTKKHNSYNGPQTYKAPDALDYQTTIVLFYQPYAFFDSNGVVINPSSISYDGAWGRGRIAELLPVDYEPEKK